MDNFLQNLIDILKEISPFLWETLVRQVHVEAGVNVFYSCLAFLFSIPTVLVAIRSYNNYQMNKETVCELTNSDLVLISGFLTAVLYIVTVTCAVNAVRYLANPDYYAVMKIIETIK